VRSLMRTDTWRAALVALVLLLLAAVAAVVHAGAFVWLLVTLAFACGAVAVVLRRGRRCSRRVVWAVAAVFLGALTLWCWVRPGEYWFLTLGWGDRPFDSAVWGKADRGELLGNSRGSMVRSLLRDHPLPGLSREDVRQLLGDPDYVDWEFPARFSEVPTDHDIRVARTFQYALGGYSGFGMDVDLLCLRFGIDGAVADWWLMQT
jgi:energy-coupling factor transporter transmembrane protein EcfT